MKRLKLAAKQAKKSSFKYRLGAVIVKGGRILSTGYNVVGKSTALFKHRWNSIHAEQSAILRLLKQPRGLEHLRGATLYVTRILSNGCFSLAKPCPVCMGTIRAVGISKVVYSISNEETGTISL